MNENDDRLGSFEANNRLFKSGFNTTVFLVLIVLLGFLFIPFPQHIKTEAYVEHSAASLPLICELSGLLGDLHPEGQLDKDEVLFSLKKEVELSSLDSSMANLDSVKSGLIVVISNFNGLGDFQKDWNELRSFSKNMALDEAGTRYIAQSSQLRNELHSEKKISKELNNTLRLTEEELSLVERRYTENKKLYDAGAISRQEIGLWKKKVLETEQKISMLNNQILELDKKMLILNDQLGLSQKDLELEKSLELISFEQKINNLYWALSTYRKKINPLAVREGKLVWNSNLKEGQYVKEGDLLGTLYPQDSPMQLVFKIAPLDKSRIKSGNKLKAYFEDYPRNEYGYLESSIIDIPSNIEKGGYQFYVPITFISSKGEQLDILPGMRSVVKVNCGSRSIFSLFLEKINY